MKKIKIALLLLLTQVLWAQQHNQYSMYMMNNYTLNPAVGGTEDYTDLKASFRKQWVSLPGGPTNFYLTGHTAIGKVKYEDPEIQTLPFHGVGGMIYNDKAGAFSKTGFYGSYAYHLPINRSLTASFGTFVGFQSVRLDADDLSFHDAQNGVQDPTAVSSQSKLKPDASLGAWLYHKNYYVGASLFQLFGNKITWSDSTITKNGKLNQHYFLTAGYRIPINDDFTLIPSLLLKNVVAASAQLDINAKLRYQEWAWLGISFRKRDALAAMIGVTLKDHWDVAYSYDLTTSKFNPVSKGSHEFLLGYRWFNQKDVKPTTQFW